MWWFLFFVVLCIVSFGSYAFGTGYEQRSRRREAEQKELAYRIAQKDYILTPKSPAVPKRDNWDGVWL